MTSFIEDLRRLLKGIDSGGLELLIIKTGYNALLPVVTAILQVECLYSFRRFSTADCTKLIQLGKALETQDAYLREKS